MCALFFYFAFYAAYAQSPSFMFDTVNVLNKNRYEEKWTLIVGNKNEPLRIERSLLQNGRPFSADMSTFYPVPWRKVIQTRFDPFYFIEVLDGPPFDEDGDGSRYGYVERRRSDTNEIVDSWPLFAIYGTRRNVTIVAFTVYMSNRSIMKTLTTYSRGYYTIPISQEVKIYKQGIDPESVGPPMKPENYLDVHIITRLRVE